MFKGQRSKVKVISKSSAIFLLKKLAAGHSLSVRCPSVNDYFSSPISVISMKLGKNIS